MSVLRPLITGSIRSVPTVRSCIARSSVYLVPAIRRHTASAASTPTPTPTW